MQIPTNHGFNNGFVGGAKWIPSIHSMTRHLQELVRGGFFAGGAHGLYGGLSIVSGFEVVQESTGWVALNLGCFHFFCPPYWFEGNLSLLDFYFYYFPEPSAKGSLALGWFLKNEPFKNARTGEKEIKPRPMLIRRMLFFPLPPTPVHPPNPPPSPAIPT